MSSSLWIQHVPAGKFITVTPTTRLLVVNACLGLTLPPGTKGRGALFFGVVGCSELRSVASLARDTCEQARLYLALDANVEYSFSVDGPFAVDLLGHYPSSVNERRAISASSAQKQSNRSGSPPTERATASAPSASATTASRDRPAPKCAGLVNPEMFGFKASLA